MTEIQKKQFNFEGTCNPSRNYMISALPRLPGIIDMIKGEHYFTLNAPPDSGKTTCLIELTRKINSEGRHYVLLCPLCDLCDVEDAETAMSVIVSRVDFSISWCGPMKLRDRWDAIKNEPYMDDPGTKVRLMLSGLCQDLDRELVVIFDNMDCLCKKPLVMFLSQLREGYLLRHSSTGFKFPSSVCLAGARDFRNYVPKFLLEYESGEEGSPDTQIFKSMTLVNFSHEEIKELYDQHTAATGQIFLPEAVDRAWFWSEGQPCLVNWMAAHVCISWNLNKYSRAATGDDIDSVANQLLSSYYRSFNPFANNLRPYSPEDQYAIDSYLQRFSLDSLMKQLSVPSFRWLIDYVIGGAKTLPDFAFDWEKIYLIDFGFLKSYGSNGELLRPSNAIFRELLIMLLKRARHGEYPFRCKV
ncbi:MAG: hypothetical protein LBT40_09470 [Deltaproteobacteria bacterium]|jgi:hypothetical protein|nr:hypothetical protein [Deltaproteobacteria bacterium]